MLPGTPPATPENGTPRGAASRSSHQDFADFGPGETPVPFGDANANPVAGGGEGYEERETVGQSGNAVSPRSQSGDFYFGLQWGFGLGSRRPRAPGAPVLSPAGGYDEAPGPRPGAPSPGAGGVAEGERTSVGRVITEGSWRGAAEESPRGLNSTNCAFVLSAKRPQVRSAKRYFLKISASTRAFNAWSSMGWAQ